MKIFGHISKVPILPTHSPILLPSRWMPVRNLFLRAWFTRVWIIQEVGLVSSTLVMCGDSRINWSEVVQFALISNARTDLQATYKQFRLSLLLGVLWMPSTCFGLDIAIQYPGEQNSPISITCPISPFKREGAISLISY